MKELDRGFVSVRGAREHNLQGINVDIPRGVLVVFTGVSGSGKSSLAFGTLYAEAQRRFLESVSPYARRLFNQMAIPEVDSIEGLPPAIALQQQRGSPSTRSSVGSVTTLSNLLRMLYSRAGDYPKGQGIIYAEGFSPHSPEGACPACQGLGRVYDATEASMVPDPKLTIRERAIAAWPPAWHGQNLRDMLVTLGFDIDKPWKKLPKKDRDWILFTDEQPSVPVYAGFEAHEVKKALKRKEEPSYIGNFSSARRYVLQTFAATQSALMKKRVAQYLVNSLCRECKGKRLKRASLSVRFEGLDIADMSALPLKKLGELLKPYASGQAKSREPLVAERIASDIIGRLEVLHDLGLGYLALDRSTPTLSPGELQRLRLATQVHSHLFGVIYVLDEPSAGLHPADTEALLRTLDRLKGAGNSLFIVEHEIDVIRHADWIVDVGPAAGQHGGTILYSGPRSGLEKVSASVTRKYLFENPAALRPGPRSPQGWLKVQAVTRNNLKDLDAAFPLGVLSSITGISGSGKSSLVSQVLVELVSGALGLKWEEEEEGGGAEELEHSIVQTEGGSIHGDLGPIKRLVRVDQKPIGRTPRSNLATYTGLFDPIRKLFASTPLARSRRYDAGRFSFNLPKGRCEHCEGEGFVMVELLFLPSVYSPCPTCQGARYNSQTLEVKYREKSIADVLGMTVDTAKAFFQDEPAVARPLEILREVGLGYLRLGQPATELSGGEAQRIKLAAELQRGGRAPTLYVLDEPTTGLHPADVERLLLQLNRLVDAGHTVLAVEHDMAVIAASDWVIDMGPGAGDEGGRIVFQGPPEKLARDAARESPTGLYLRRYLASRSS